MRIKQVTAALTAMNIGSVAKGLAKIPNKPNSFTISPMSIRKAMLNPTDKTMISARCGFSTLNVLRRRYPGTKPKKMKPNT